MSVLNDDGISLNINMVFLLFLMPNLIFVVLTFLNIALLSLSKGRPALNRSLGRVANCFAKGALDRIIKNMVRHFEQKKRQQEDNISMSQARKLYMRKSSETSKHSPTSSDNRMSQKKYDATYILLIPFQIDLLLTVFVYKILTREVYAETCQSFLSTYANRHQEVSCWLKHINRNLSNLSFNISLQRYCENQTITYINFEHNDVICIQYVFKLINIIDTVTNIFAWHQAIVFVVTKCIVFSYWYQEKLRETSCWSKIINVFRRTIMIAAICLTSSIYVLLFIFIIPIRSIFIEGTRIDLTAHLLYACSKFLIAIIAHINIYTLYQWHSHTKQEKQLLEINEEKEIEYQQAVQLMAQIATSKNGSPGEIIESGYYRVATPSVYVTPRIST